MTNGVQRVYDVRYEGHGIPIDAPLFVPLPTGEIINLHAAIEIEEDPDDPGTVMLIMAAPGFTPDTPHIVALTGEIAQLALAHFRAQSEAGLARLRARYGADRLQIKPLVEAVYCK